VSPYAQIHTLALPKQYSAAEFTTNFICCE